MHRGEQAYVQEFIPEHRVVNEFSTTDLPRAACLDVSNACAAFVAPALQGMRNELGVIVAANEARLVTARKDDASLLFKQPSQT